MPPVHEAGPRVYQNTPRSFVWFCLCFRSATMGFSGGPACAKGYCPSLVSVTDSMLPALVPPSGLYNLLQVNVFFVFENVPSSSGFSVFDKMCFRCRRLLGSSVM